MWFDSLSCFDSRFSEFEFPSGRLPIFIQYPNFLTTRFFVSATPVLYYVSSPDSGIFLWRLPVPHASPRHICFGDTTVDSPSSFLSLSSAVPARHICCPVLLPFPTSCLLSCSSYACSSSLCLLSSPSCAADSSSPPSSSLFTAPLFALVRPSAPSLSRAAPVVFLMSSCVHKASRHLLPKRRVRCGVAFSMGIHDRTLLPGSLGSLGTITSDYFGLLRVTSEPNVAPRK